MNGEGAIDEGEALAKAYCSSCHAFVEPEALPKRSWPFLLTHMGMRLGIDDRSSLGEISAEEKDVLDARKLLLELTGQLPEESALTEKEWESIRNYYVSAAPAKIGRAHV